MSREPVNKRGVRNMNWLNAVIKKHGNCMTAVDGKLRFLLFSAPGEIYNIFNQ